MILNEEFFDDIDITDDDIKNNIDNNIITSKQLDSYQYYINVHTIDKHINKKLSYIIRNNICVSDCITLKYYIDGIDIEYNNENEILNDDNNSFIITYGINADFNYKYFMMLLKNIFSIFKDVVFCIGFYTTYPVIKNNPNSHNIADITDEPSIANVEQVVEVLELLNIKYDWNILLADFNMSVNGIFKEYLKHLYTGYKNNIIFAGETEPTQMTDDILSEFSEVKATNILSEYNSSLVYRSFDPDDIYNTDIRKHIIDSCNGNKPRFYIVVSTRGKTNCFITFYVYYSKICKVSNGNTVRYKSCKKPVNCMVMLLITHRMNMKYIEDSFRIYEKLGFNVPELISQALDVIPNISGQYESVYVKQMLANIKQKFIK